MSVSFNNYYKRKLFDVVFENLLICTYKENRDK